MSKFYTANEELGKYLKKLGLTFHNREEEGISYFTDSKTGKQVKINSLVNTIAFLDSRGFEVDYSSSYTSKEIQSFLNTEQ